MPAVFEEPGGLDDLDELGREMRKMKSDGMGSRGEDSGAAVWRRSCWHGLS
ncbi:MAG TPA: hypothetical protein VIA62_24785 [Thermoanaerobaculia bacterium]|jgi:hypothetical protein|nr:hypothetical protein [Thermoanaerobaculia bacterium]